MSDYLFSGFRACFFIDKTSFRLKIVEIQVGLFELNGFQISVIGDVRSDFVSRFWHMELLLLSTS